MQGFCLPYQSAFITTHEFSHSYACDSLSHPSGGSERLHGTELPAGIKLQDPPSSLQPPQTIITLKTVRAALLL